MSSDRDIFETIFKEAQKDVRQMEKSAFLSMPWGNLGNFARGGLRQARDVARHAWGGLGDVRGYKNLAKETDQLAAKNKKLTSQLDEAQAARQAAEETAQNGMSPWRAAGYTAAGTGALGTGAYMYGTHREREEGRKNRNRAFGAGLAAGSAAPPLFDHLSSAASNFFGSGGQ